MGTVDQLLELLGRAVGGVGRVGQYAVIAPIALAGKLRQRHQFNRGDAQLGQARQVFLDASVAAHGTDVKLVDDRRVPGRPCHWLWRHS